MITKKINPSRSFQELIVALQHYWMNQGCTTLQSYDLEKGAATFNPATFLRALGPDPLNAAFVEPCRRPTDGRYGDNPIRLQHYYQFQVLMKPCPDDFQERYLGSLSAIGIDPHEHDIRFVHDDWESPTLGAWGLGWEVWIDGLEITQFTYFQQMGNVELHPITGEIAYGLERLAMFLQKKNSVYELCYDQNLSYADLFKRNEIECCRYNFEIACIKTQLALFKHYESECNRICQKNLAIPALDYCLKASHTFNLLDARGVISVSERQHYILRIQALARQIAHIWIKGDPSPVLYDLAQNPRYDPLFQQPGIERIKNRPKSRQAEFNPVKNTDTPQSFLLEVGVEEMPVLVCQKLIRTLEPLVNKWLQSIQLEGSGFSCFITPRRFTIVLDCIKHGQDNNSIPIRGPSLERAKDKDGQWTLAALGFAKKYTVDVNQLDIQTVKAVDYLCYQPTTTQATISNILYQGLPRFLSSIPWYKTMRWGNGDTRFVRPIRWLLALFGDQIIPFEFAGLKAGNQSFGHRVLSNKRPMIIRSDQDGYVESLRQAWVIVDHNERKTLLRDQIIARSKKNKCVWRPDERLLDELTHLVEYPVPIVCRFPESFLELPDPVLTSVMKTQQKYSPLYHETGQLSNRFIAVANISCQAVEQLRKGYEDVLCAHFSDASFFVKEDRTKKLDVHGKKLQGRIFSEGLGTLSQKVERLQELAMWISKELSLKKTQQHTLSAIALLCKADLSTHMIKEYSELQGEMGRYYAIKEGFNPLIADGIRDHYYPRHLNDRFPINKEAAIIGIADRMDSIVGFFATGKAPTGSADPYGLRRACRAVIALVVHHELHIDLKALLDTSINSYAFDGQSQLSTRLETFFLSHFQRLFHQGEWTGLPGPFPQDHLAAVSGNYSGRLDCMDRIKRLKAMSDYASKYPNTFAALVTAIKRVNNILDNIIDGRVTTDLLRHNSEQILFKQTHEIATTIYPMLSKRRYAESIALLSTLSEPINLFFEALMVNDPEPQLRLNRHRLLQDISKLVLQFSDLSRIEGK